ncbi:MAG: outer membrane beta-barrel protein [Bacteroidales bacterium]
MHRKSYRAIAAMVLILISISLYGQKERPMNKSWYDDKVLHFGFSLGFNTMDFNITPESGSYFPDSLLPEVSILSPGINIQIVIDYRPAKYWDLRFLPGVSFGQRNVIFYKDRVVENDMQKIESSFIELPLRNTRTR